MARPDEHPICPHCGTPLKAFRLPDDAGYDSNCHLACFNDDCPYYREGWTWMQEQYAAHASYRYRVDPLTGTAIPIPVWSETALVDRIVESNERGSIKNVKTKKARKVKKTKAEKAKVK